MSYRPSLNGAILVLLLCALSVSPKSQAQTYRATSLGPNTFAEAINNAGQVVGATLSNAVPVAQPFLWANGTLISLGLFGGGAGVSNGINNDGQIVGYIIGLTGSNHPGDATLWANGTITNLSSTLIGLSHASGINSSGQVVGTTQVGTDPCIPPGPDNPGANNAFIWSGGVLSSLDPSTSEDSVVAAINDSGDAVGYVQSPLVSACAPQATLFTGGTTTILPQLPGSNSSTTTAANAINNAGQIVGSTLTQAASGAASQMAVLWYNSTVTSLGAGQAAGINNFGQIVGTVPVTNGSDAAIWMQVGANALDLNQLIDPATPVAPWVLTQVKAINDSGWIVAIASVDGGTTAQSFLLQPEALSLSVTPSTLTFASEPVGKQSVAQSVFVNNNGPTAFSFNPMVVTGDFTQTNNCGTSLPPGSSCSFEIAFGPLAPGPRTGVLTIASGGTSNMVNLTGSGTITVALNANASLVLQGTPVTLYWSAPGTTCKATGGSTGDGWTGSLAGIGSKAVTEPVVGKHTYGITCTGGGQTGTAQTSFTVGLPSVTLSAAPSTVNVGQPFTLTWATTLIGSGYACVASGGTSGDGWSVPGAHIHPGDGSMSIKESASGSYSYTLTCGPAKGMAVVTVNAIPRSGSGDSGGGGGGAIDTLSLLSLVTMLGMRHRRRLRQCSLDGVTGCPPVVPAAEWGSTFDTLPLL